MTVPNLIEFFPNMWRMGQPVSIDDWEELRDKISPDDHPVTIVKLNDEHEGSDGPAEGMGWTVVRLPLAPEDDKPWTVFEVPDLSRVHAAVSIIVGLQRADRIVAWHCTHGKDRTGLVSALVGMALFGWDKTKAWNDMLEHGFRWELPGLEVFWLEDVKS